MGPLKAPDSDDNPDVPLHGRPSTRTISQNLVRASRVYHLSRTQAQKMCWHAGSIIPNDSVSFDLRVDLSLGTYAELFWITFADNANTLEQ